MLQDSGGAIEMSYKLQWEQSSAFFHAFSFSLYCLFTLELLLL